MYWTERILLRESLVGKAHEAQMPLPFVSSLLVAAENVS